MRSNIILGSVDLIISKRIRWLVNLVGIICLLNPDLSNYQKNNNNNSKPVLIKLLNWDLGSQASSKEGLGIERIEAWNRAALLAQTRTYVPPASLHWWWPIHLAKQNLYMSSKAEINLLGMKHNIWWLFLGLTK
jgi:hypothetical protein